MTQLGIYESAVPLTPQRHGDVSVHVGTDYAFSARLTSVPLLAIEFRDAAAEYPIAFARSTDVPIPLVVLGVRQDENLFVSADSGWRARYQPAFVRRYPFVFGTQPEQERLVLCIDEAYPGLNREGRGNRLFEPDGKSTAYLERMLKFLEEYQAQVRRTRIFCSRLEELGLLAPIDATVALPGSRSASLKGLLGVDRNKLKALSDETLGELARGDALEAVFLHLQSLRNLGQFHERLATRQPGRVTVRQ